MSKEATPLQRVMKETTLTLVNGLRDLTLGVHEAITAENSSSPSRMQIAAALFMISQLAGAQAEIFRQNPTSVASDEEGALAPNTPAKLLTLSKESEAVRKPTTFSELLRFKIDEKLLPPQQAGFTKIDLRSLVRDLGYGAKRFLEHDPSINDNSTREQAIDLIEKFLRVDHKPDNNSPFARAHILADWGVPARLIDIWTKEINYDWIKNPSVVSKEADAIRGLNRLTTILKNRKKT